MCVCVCVCVCVWIVRWMDLGIHLHIYIYIWGPTCRAATRLCRSRRALWLWWDMRRSVHGPWSDRSVVEMQGSWRRPRRARPRSPAQPAVEWQARIGAASLLCTLGASQPGGYCAHPTDGTLSTHDENGRESPARSAHLTQNRTPWRLREYPGAPCAAQ